LQGTEKFMATEKTNPKTKEKEEPKIGGEPKPKKERQSDTRKPTSPEQEVPKATREVDFMGWD
jgi:hypothetical protein